MANGRNGTNGTRKNGLSQKQPKKSLSAPAKKLTHAEVLEQGGIDHTHPDASPQSGYVLPAKFRWKPGQSGNPNGRPRGVSLTSEMRRMIDEGVEIDGKRINVKEALVQRALQEAIKGDFNFFKLIVERMDGKVPDELNVDGLAINVTSVAQLRAAITNEDE